MRMDITKQIEDRFRDKLQRKALQVVRQAKRNTMASLAAFAPQSKRNNRTGTLMANYAAMSLEKFATVSSIKKKQTGQYAGVVSIEEWQFGDPIFFVNPVAYAKVYEFGRNGTSYYPRLPLTLAIRKVFG